MKRTSLLTVSLLVWPVIGHADHDELKPPDYPTRPIEKRPAARGDSRILGRFTPAG